MKKSIVVILLLVAMPLVLVGCSKSQTPAIKDSVNGFVDAYNTRDFERCTDYLVGVTDANKATTESLLQDARQLSGEIAVTSIEDISVNGSSATATVTSIVRGQTKTRVVNLTKVDGVWKFEGEGLLSESGG